MALAKRPSSVTLPNINKGWVTVFDFLCETFSHIDSEQWQLRIKQRKIFWKDANASVEANSDSFISMQTLYHPNRTLCYFREVKSEPVIEAKHRVIFQNEHILIADKPHFLPVTPGGQYVNECLLERLRTELDLPSLVPAHRLDRETAGLVLFSVNEKTRGNYCQLFANRLIHKRYHAVANIEHYNEGECPKTWSIANRIIRGEPAFTHKQVDGVINAESEITLLQRSSHLGFFLLKPITGKTHQLRLHMTKIGMPILNDRFYPKLFEKQPDDTDNPLQLLAKELSFVDPLTGLEQTFTSKLTLRTWS